MDNLTKRVEKIETRAKPRPHSTDALFHEIYDSLSATEKRRFDELLASLSDSSGTPEQPDPSFVIVVEVPAEEDGPRPMRRKPWRSPLSIQFVGPPDIEF